MAAPRRRIQTADHCIGTNFIATEAISEAETTTPEGIAKWVTVMLSTFKDLLENQANHRIRSMMCLILLVAMD